MAKDWHITHQKQESVLNDDGNGFTQQWNVGYMIHDGPANGTRGEVHARNADLDPEKIGAAISAQVARHQSVASL